MSKIRLTFEYNNKTGKRDIHIDYESDSSLFPHEHEENHRNILREIIDLEALEKEDIELSRNTSEKMEEPEKKNGILKNRIIPQRKR